MMVAAQKIRIEIRDYRQEDCAALAGIFHRAVREIARKDYSRAQVLAWAPQLPDLDTFAARRSARSTFVAEYDTQPAGFTDLNTDGHIDMFYVNPDFQRQPRPNRNSHHSTLVSLRVKVTPEPGLRRRG